MSAFKTGYISKQCMLFISQKVEGLATGNCFICSMLMSDLSSPFYSWDLSIPVRSGGQNYKPDR